MNVAEYMKDQTPTFVSLRNQYHNQEKNKDEWNSDISSDKATTALLSHNTNHIESDDNVSHIAISALPPRWLDVVDDAHELMNTIEQSIQKLELLYQKRLRVSFEGIESHLENEIENFSAKINECINRVSMKIKEIAIIDSDNLTEADKDIRKGMMQSIGIQLHDIVLRFRSLQRNFVVQIKAQDLVGSKDLIMPSTNTSDTTETLNSKQVLDSQYALEDAFDIGLTQEQEAQIRDLEEYADAKEKEIIHLVQSINELSSMFQELNVLVIEQGTILDRIDYNIVSTLERVQKGTVELQSANKHSKNTITMRAILILICIIMFEILILIFKHHH